MKIIPLKNLWSKNLSKTTIIALMLLLFLFWISWSAWVKRQDEIHISINNAINGFTEAGYEIKEVKYVNDYYAGYQGIIKNGAYVEVISKGKEYSVIISQETNWEEAKNRARRNNQLSSLQDWVFGYAFYFGDLTFHIQPASKELGNELYKVIKRMEQ